MLAVKAPVVAIAAGLAKTTCTVVCINSPTSTVVSGPKAEVQQLAELLKSGNVDAITLDYPYAFYSP
jgi:naphtho-gamma-pyrone polyketide synthase